MGIYMKKLGILIASFILLTKSIFADIETGIECSIEGTYECPESVKAASGAKCECKPSPMVMNASAYTKSLGLHIKK